MVAGGGWCMWPRWRGAPGSRDHRARPSPARALDEAAAGTRAEDAKPTSALVHEQPKASISSGPKYRAGVTAAHASWVRPTARTRVRAGPPQGARSFSVWALLQLFGLCLRPTLPEPGAQGGGRASPFLDPSVTFHEQPYASDSCAPAVGRKPTPPGKET